MELFEVIYKRRSIRSFKNKRIPEKILNKVIDAGRWSPSACNRQAWRFIIIDDESIRKKIIDECTAYFVKDVPLLILVLYDNRTDNLEYQDHVQSAAACVQNMQLAAYSLGLGSCCVANLPPKNIMRRILKLPLNYDPICFLALGYPKVIPKPLPRKQTIEQLISQNKFDFKEPRISIFDARLRIKRLLRFVYFRLPKWLKKSLYPIAKKFEKRFDQYDIEL